jgi:exodeoxyribonuclease VIII
MKLQMTAAEYHGRPEISASMLKAARKGAPHLRAFLDGTNKVGPAAALGTAAHSMLLTPRDFDAEIAVSPDVDRRTKAGKAAHAEFAETVGNRTVITPDQHETAAIIANAVKNHAAAAALLAGAECETTFIWEGNKARIDAVNGSTLIDLKTTRDASPDAYIPAIFRYGVHLQLAWYRRALEYHGTRVDRCVIIAAENAEPFGVAVYEMDAETMQLGEAAVDHALAQLNANAANGYAAAPIVVTPPRWVKR